MATVRTKTPGYTGHIGKDLFVDGVCEVPDTELDYYIRQGYVIEYHDAVVPQPGAAAEPVTEITEPEPVAEPEEPESAIVLPHEDALKPEWVAVAESLGISVKGLSRDQIKARVHAAVGKTSEA